MKNRSKRVDLLMYHKHSWILFLLCQRPLSITTSFSASRTKDDKHILVLRGGIYYTTEK